ncbi:glycosyltransferase [uncultured Desulfovibrio sp.]|uniref:glycosyltransferase n=1 Tax=uncultured Desulfovibrio sp. TaxID=167968 RepID=UPI002804FB4E|nr:glycosyltransferase [uncultured Desulfovibrio sp.]
METGLSAPPSAALAGQRSLRICILFDMHYWLYGGGPKFTWELAHAMIARGHEVSIYSSATSKKEPPYKFDARIRMFRVSLSDKHENIALLRKKISQENYDVALSMQGGAMQLYWAVVLMGTGIPLVYSEHSFPARVEQFWSRAGRLAAMSGADAIHLLLPEFINSLPAWLHDRVTCIPNSAPDVVAPVARHQTKPRTIVSLGRFAAVKQIPLLVEAFGLLHDRFPDWMLDIWGYGEEENAILKAIAQSPAKSAIRMRGIADLALGIFAQAQLFCIPSRCEGFGLTVLEAMSQGTPAIGFAGCAGVNHIIKDGENGLLAPEMTPQSLADTLAKAMGSAGLRNTLAQGALKTAQEYAPGPIFDQWEALLLSTASIKGHTRMDAFSEEPFASMARLSAAARREWLFRDFGRPWPGTLRWYAEAARTAASKLWKSFQRRFE